MKILHVTPMYAPALGGAELHLKAISEGLVARGHDVTVLTSNVRSVWDLWPPRFGALPSKEEINGVKVIRFSPNGGFLGNAYGRWLRLRGGVRTASCVFGSDGAEMLSQSPRVFAMIPYIIRSAPDIVTAMNWYWPPAYHTYLARKLKKFTLVGIPLFHTMQPWCQRVIYDRMLASCDAVVVNTSHEGQYAQQRGATRVEVSGVGVYPKSFEKRNSHEIRMRYGLSKFPVVGFVGRQDEKKGAPKVVEAMRDVWKWNKEVRLVLAGPRSPHKKDIEALIEELSESQRERIIDIGAFDEKDKASIVDAIDVLALPSTEESFGITYLEAWLCKKPVIGARIGSTQCVIDEGVDGLLVNPADPQDIAQAIIALLSNREMRERMGRSGHAKTIAQHTWDKVTDKVERLYLELVAAKAVGRRSLQAQDGRPL
jgi:glycosyltransferase involved in cell wall biosynthesis